MPLGGRVKSRLRTLIVFGAVMIGSFTASACDAFDPCPETKKQEKAGQLDGTWFVQYLTDKNGLSGLPYQPLGKFGPELSEGSLIFQTTSAIKGASCTELLKTEGIVIADYEYIFTGRVKDFYTGHFVFDHTTGVLTLRGGKYTRSVTVKDTNGDRDIIASVDAAELKKEYAFLGQITIVFNKPF